MADDFDLYDDLDDALIQPLEKDLEKQKSDEAEKLAAEKTWADKIKKLQAQLDEMSEKKNNLNTNMTYLLETSIEELRRKDSMIKEWRRKWDELMFRRNKSTRSVHTQTDFQPENRPRDRSRDSRRPHHRSPEKNRRNDDKGSSTENDQKLIVLSRVERPRNHSTDRIRDNDRPRGSKSSRKRSKSQSPRRLDEKKRKNDDQLPKHTEPRKEPDLRLKLLKKHANRSSPRKLKVDTTSKVDPQPKVASPRQRKLIQSQNKGPVEVLSIKSSDSEVEIVHVVSSNRVDFKTVSLEKPDEEKIQQKVESNLAEVAVYVDDKKIKEIVKIILDEESTSFHSADDASKSPKLSELEKEILAAENFSLEKGVEQNDSFDQAKTVEPNLVPISMQSNAEVILEELNYTPKGEALTAEDTSDLPEPNVTIIDAPTVAEPSSASVNEIIPQESLPAKQKTSKSISVMISKSSLSSVIAKSPVTDNFDRSSPAEPKSSPIKATASPPAPEINGTEFPNTKEPPQPDKSLQLLLNGTLDSSGASEENSINRSQKKKRSSKIYQKEVQEDGTVVFTISRKSKKKKKEVSKA